MVQKWGGEVGDNVGLTDVACKKCMYGKYSIGIELKWYKGGTKSFVSYSMWKNRCE